MKRFIALLLAVMLLTTSALAVGGMKRGDRGDVVRLVQERLWNMGYMSGPMSNHVDGVFGKGTEEALINAETELGLVPDGVLTPDEYATFIELSGSGPAMLCFRDLPWFSTYRDVCAELYPQYEATADVPAYAYPRLYGTDAVRLYGATAESEKDAAEIQDGMELGFLIEIAPLPVAGYEPSMQHMEFLYPVEDDKINPDWNSAQLIFAWYTFTDTEYDPAAVFDDLTLKLETIYGGYSENKVAREFIHGVERVWMDGWGNRVVLFRDTDVFAHVNLAYISAQADIAIDYTHDIYLNGGVVDETAESVVDIAALDLTGL